MFDLLLLDKEVLYLDDLVDHIVDFSVELSLALSSNNIGLLESQRSNVIRELLARIAQLIYNLLIANNSMLNGVDWYIGALTILILENFNRTMHFS